ncbi:UNVERIFIED_CONTAM: hypothetical protein NCL1_34553 [Trichonephila clavipes]
MGDRLWAFGQLSVWFGTVSINLKSQNDERRRKEHICDQLPCFNTPHSMPALRIFHSFSGSHKNTFVLETNYTKVLNTFYQHLKSTSVTLHKAGFL